MPWIDWHRRELWAQRDGPAEQDAEECLPAFFSFAVNSRRFKSCRANVSPAELTDYRDDLD